MKNYKYFVGANNSFGTCLVVKGFNNLDDAKAYLCSIAGKYDVVYLRVNNDSTVGE